MDEIRLLKMGKEYEKASEYAVHSYSKRLIELYALNTDKESEKLERRADLLAYQGASLDDFRKYRTMCTDKEWSEDRLKIIDSRAEADDT